MDGRGSFIVQEVQVVAAPAEDCFTRNDLRVLSTFSMWGSVMVVSCDSSSPAGWQSRRTYQSFMFLFTCCKSAKDGETAERAVGADTAA